jgi:MFS family permease
LAVVTDPVHEVLPDEPEPPRSWRVDTTPLRESRDFRIIWTSGLVTYFGSITTYVALPFQIKELTGSLALAGLLSAVEIVPLVLFGLWGGAIADAFDRRRTVIACELLMLLMSAGLLANALLDQPRVWPLFVIAGLFATADALQRPSLDALIQQVVPHRQMIAASALSSIRYSIGSIAGPALAGVLLTVGSTWMAYGFDVLTYVGSLLILLRLGHIAAPAGDVASLRGVVEGIRYAVSRKDLLGTYLVDVLAMIFGMTTAIFPFVATVYGAPWAVGLLYAAESVGSLAVSLTSGWTARVHRQGRAIAFAAAGFGVAIVCFGLAPNIWFALAALVVAGATDMTSGIFRTAMWNQTIPMHLRGRMAGVEMLSYSVGPIVGNARSGLVASATSVRFAIVSGGALCVLSVAAAAALMKEFRSYDERSSPHAVQERAARGET